jgi:23S rRNA pseudouridine1911/1915/1917 synthase
VISAPIARKEDRCLRRVVDFQKGDRAVTHYRVIATEVMDGISRSLVALQLETGRTHQIRVHMAYLGYPLVGDFLYNPTYVGNQIDRREDLENKNEDASGTEAGVRQKPYDIDRQALHAWKLSFPHPMTGEPMEFTAPLPPDMQKLIPEEALPSV